MGVRITLNGRVVKPSEYTISESSTPLAGGDSSGAVGSIDLTLPREKDAAFLDMEKGVDLLDTDKGTSLGTVRNIKRESLGVWNVSAVDRLGEFMVEVQSQPFTGTLENAFVYYCSLANIDSDIFVDPAIGSNPVNFPGFNGNLWNHMKMMATGVGADLNLISSIVVLRPVREFVAIQDRQFEQSVTLDGTRLAQKQEVVWYDTKHEPNGLIYPPGGWSRDQPTPLSVNAGETVVTDIPVEASITSLDQPLPMSSVPPDWDSSSVYTVVGDDNIVIPPQQWLDYGGSLRVDIGEDTRSIIVTMTGASGLFQADGAEMKTFRIAMSAGTSDSTYSTLRVVGDAIHLNEQSIIIPTGVEPWRTAQEFAPTIDNIFLNNLDAAYSAGSRGASRHSGKQFTLTAGVVAVNRRGDTGSATYPTYGEIQADWGGDTYADIQALNAGKTYGQVSQEILDAVVDDFDNQLFGNAPGARYWDRPSARWYRIRTAKTTWGSTSITADDDLTVGDIEEHFAGLSYADVQARVAGNTYFDVNVLGMSA